MRRRIFTIASVVSLLLCVATIVLWVRGAAGKITFVFMRHGVLWELASHDGRLWLDDEPERAELDRVLIGKMKEAMRRPVRSRMGHQLTDPELYELILQLCDRAGLRTNSTPTIAHSFPCSAAAGATAIVPLAWVAFIGLPLFFKRINRRLRSRRGHCLNCGYDVRASKERCPECGTVVEGKSMPLKTQEISN